MKDHPVSERYSNLTKLIQDHAKEASIPLNRIRKKRSGKETNNKMSNLTTIVM